jgi:uncharacterized protein YndB with AHSA1/START domain/uncharacterized protein YciI
MQKPQHFFGRLLGTRPNWPNDMTEAEGKIMSAHFDRLKKLTQEKKVLVAGPCFAKPVFGLVIMEVADEAEAKAIAADDPAVKAGLMTYDLAPLTLSLMADNRPSYRYAETPSDKVLHKEVTVKGTIESVWHAWTTTEGTQSFFSPATHIELRPGGAYEIFFNVKGPIGERGSEDCKVLSFVPNQMLSFEWNAPPEFKELRRIRTVVVVRFEPTTSGEVKISFDHLGWGIGPDWDKLYAYFDQAWDYVLGNCQKRFAEGPIDWTK